MYLSESCYIKLNLYCYYLFPIDLPSNEILFGAKSIGKGNYNPNLVWFNKIEKKVLCVNSGTTH